MRHLFLALLLVSSAAVAEEPVPVTPEQQQPQEPVAPPAENQPVPEGQWVYTGTYGWVYMPWGEQYVNSPAGVQYPQQYVWYPAVGWTWLVSPWVWGWGPYPYYGAYGYGHFAWYGRPYYGHWYGHVGPYRTWRGPVRYYRGAPPVYRGPGHYGPPVYHPAPSRGGGGHRR